MRNVICTCWDSHEDLLSASEYKISCSKYEEGFIIIANFFLHLQTWIHHLNTSEYISFASRQTPRTRAARQNLSIDGENSPEVSTSFLEYWITHSSCVGSNDFVALLDSKDSCLFSYLSWHAFAHLLCMLCDQFVNRWRKFARSFYIFSRVLNNTFFLRRIKRFCGFIGLQRFLLVFIFILTRVRTFTVYALRSFMSNLHFICIAYSLNFERVF